MKIMKKIIAILCAFATFFSVMSNLGITAFATSKTQSEAVNWANSKIGQSLDYDGVYGAQCVDFIKYYYSYLGVNPVKGNGCDYATNSLPSGWNRIKYYSGFSAQPGDIAVWTYASSAYGHVAIVTNADANIMYVDEQNGSTGVTRAHSYKYTYGTFYGVIRPNFTNVNIPFGCVDVVEGGVGRIRVRGWAIDKDNTSTSLQIHVYIGGPAGSSNVDVHVITANKLREDVNNVYGAGKYHGFDEYIPTTKTGSQPVYCYAINIGSGSNDPNIGSGTANITKDSVKPTISNVKTTNVSKSGYTVTFTATDNVVVDSVKCPTWTTYNGQDDLNWNENVTRNGNNYTCTIKTATHNNELGVYATHIYAYDKAGNQTMYGVSINLLETIQSQCSHNYYMKEYTSPTCTRAGEAKYICSQCGYSYTKKLAELSHEESDYLIVDEAATLKSSGKMHSVCIGCGSVYKNYTITKIECVELSSNSYLYNGKVKRPSIKVYDEDGNAVDNDYYDVTYSSGRKNVGKYSVKITFKGNYSGTVTKTFTVKPKATSVNKLTALKGGIKVYVNKQATQTTGYQIQYSTSSNFANAKTATIGKNTTLSKSITGLAKGKKYYVRVRTYKTVNGTKYYSSWSKAKSVTTKK